MTILADTSAWIEYLRASGSQVHVRVRDLIVAGQEMCVSEPVIAELLMGPTDDQAAALLRKFLVRFRHLPFHAVVDFDGAVRIYRACRRQGVTPRGLIDCMVANVALRHRARLLSHDSDLARIAEVMGIELDPASLR